MSDIPSKIETVIIGGGQAGLAVSHHLALSGQEHIILEQERVAQSWRSRRWDSFRLVIPNGLWDMPGMTYQGDDPEGFMSKQEIAAEFDRYVSRCKPPLVSGLRVTGVRRQAGGQGYEVAHEGGATAAHNVVVATGAYQALRVPAWSADVARGVLQVSSDGYKNPGQLPPGGVLVVGSGQSGVQIADELLHAGHDVFLSVGSCGWLPRRYRERDVTWWLCKMGFLETTVDTLPSPKARSACFPQLTGLAGGRTLNAHVLAEQGTILLGRACGGNGYRVSLAGDLEENLAKADAFTAQVRQAIDQCAAHLGMGAASDDEWPRYGHPRTEPVRELDLAACGVRTIVWAAGYWPDFSWIDIPIFDLSGYPAHRRGVTDEPGLFFAGLPWLYRRRSATLLAGDEDAAHLAAAVNTRCVVR